MANETALGSLSAVDYSSLNFVNVKAVEEAAYLMLYESTLMPKLCKTMGQGVKGSALHWTYFDPTTFAGAASTGLQETVDFTTRHALTNASVYVTASEFGIQSFLTDVLKESSGFDFQGELARQQGIGVAVGLEKHILSVVSATAGDGGFTSRITATDPDSGLSYTTIAAGKTILDAKLIQVPGEKQLVMPDYAYFHTAKGTYSTTYQAAIPQFGDKVLSNWYITTAFGDVRIFRNNHITIANSAAICPMFVKDAVGLWTPRDYRLEPDRDPSARGVEFTSTMRAGAKVLVPAWGVAINAYAGAPA